MNFKLEPGFSPYDEMWYLVRLVLASFAVVCITGICIWLMISNNEEMYRDIRCINAACEKPCVTGQKLKRHEGCIK